jgi:hypothetical protein
MKFTSILGLLAIVAAMDGAAAKNDKKKKGELSEASFVLIGDSITIPLRPIVSAVGP